MKLLIAAGLVAFLFATGRLNLAVLANVRSQGHLIGAMALLLLAGLGPVWRWAVLLRIQRLGVGGWAAVRMTWAGYFAGLFLPGAAGGDLAKAYVACRHQPDAKTRAVSTVLLDRAMGLHSLLTLGAVAGITVLLRGAQPQQAAVAWTAVILCASVTIGAVLLFWRRTTTAIQKLLPRRLRKPMRDSLCLYRAGGRRLAGAWLYSIFCNVLAIWPYVFVASALGLSLPVVRLAIIVPLIILFNSLPLTPGGLGVGEAAGSELFAAFGVPNGGIVVLLIRLGSVLMFLPGGLCLLWPIRPSLRIQEYPSRLKESAQCVCKPTRSS